MHGDSNPLNELFICTSYCSRNIPFLTTIILSKADNDEASVDKSEFLEDGQNGIVAFRSLSFHDIHYTVPSRAGRCQKIGKTILRGVSGVFNQGLNAIMGPTGSGKTTLLDILAARSDTGRLTGKILLNGQPLPSDFRLISGYVTQDDVVMGTLTVRENLTFSAALRLPSSVNKKEREQRVQDVIEELGLERCADTKIGNELIRGVSGGERKRTSIGMELIIKPEILFLDEPTTGLDSSTARSVMTLLAQLSERGRTIIFSIHQPRYQIYHLFKRLHLLSRGETVYHGLASSVLDFFSENGYERQEQDNPADFLLDSILSNEEDISKLDKDIAAIDTSTNADNTNEKTCYYNTAVTIETIETSTPTQERNALSECFKTSNYNDTHVSGINVDIPGTESSVLKVSYKTSFISQVRHVGSRAFQNMLRNPTTRLQVVMVLIFGVLLGSLYFQLDRSPETAIQDRAGALFMIVMQGFVFNLNTMNAFLNERNIYIQESRGGYYRTSVYFIAKMVCDVIPLRIFLITLYGTIPYWMIGFQTQVTAYFVYIGTLIMMTLSAAAWYLVIGTLVDAPPKALPFFALSVFIMLIFSGFILNVNSFVSWLAWIKYISIIRYSLNTVVSNELSDQTFCNSYPDNSTCAIGKDYLDQQSIDYSTRGLWMNQIGMIGISVSCFVLIYIRLRMLRR